MEKSTKELLLVRIINQNCWVCARTADRLILAIRIFMRNRTKLHFAEGDSGAEQSSASPTGEPAAAKATPKPSAKRLPAAWGNTGIYQFTGASGVKITVVDPTKLGNGMKDRNKVRQAPARGTRA